MLGSWDGARLELRELHRFANGAVNMLGHLQWDTLHLWSETKNGLARYAADYAAPLAGIGVDTWGVDFALLDRAGNLLGNPYHYRDSRTEGMLERVFQHVPRRMMFAQTGIQFMSINTLYQLFSMVESGDARLRIADTLLMMPDLFHYWLTGSKIGEYTIASTTQMLDARERRWAVEMLSPLGIPTRLLPALIPPGTIIGQLRPEVIAGCGLKPAQVIAVGSHDTASAVAAVPGLDAHSCYISSGTWSLVGVEIAVPIINDRARELNFTNEGGVSHTIRLLKNVTGLWLLQSCQQEWQRAGHDYSWSELLALAGQADTLRSLIDPDAAEFLNPDDMPAAIRAFCRRTGQPQPETVGAIARCCLESLALKYRWVIAALESLTGVPIQMVRVVGGGSQNALLCQFTADATGKPVVAGPVEATAIGNVLMQTITTGHLASLAEGRAMVARSFPLKEYEPHPSDVWDAAYMRFLKWLA